MRLIYTILYRGLEHLWVSVPMGDPGTNSPRILLDNLSFEGVQNYTSIFYCTGVRTPNPHGVQRSTVINVHKLSLSWFLERFP